MSAVSDAKTYLSPDDLPAGLIVCLGDESMGTSFKGDARIVHVPDAFDGRNLPYVDNLVNAIVSVGPPSGALRTEILRALAPGGVAFILRDSTGEVAERIVKPQSDSLDDWTHFWQGPDNNGVAEDTVVGPPQHMQWLAGPQWTRHHDVDKGGNPSIRPLLTAGGRLYYMLDETVSSDMSVPASWVLLARDAFNGILLWKRSIQVASRSKLDQVWRTMVVDEKNVYVPLAPGAPLSVLDGASGELLRTCKGTEGYTEVVKDGATLYLVCGGMVKAVSATTGETAWGWSTGEGESIILLTLAASGGSIFVRTDKRVCCLAGQTGTLQWDWAAASHAKPMPKQLVATHERLLVAGGVVLVSHGGDDPNVLKKDAAIYKGSHARIHDYDGKLSALSADSGKVLWTSEYLPNLDDRKPGEIYVVGDTVWMGPDFSSPRDLRSGKVKQKRDVLNRLWTDGHHYRCYPGKATSRYIMTAKRGIEFFDIKGEEHSRNNWLRSTCTIGVTPANGLLYNPPHSCGCYIEAQLFGFWALAGSRGKESGIRGQESEVNRLVKGPAFGKLASDGATRMESSWPTYRGNSERGGSIAMSLPREMSTRWTAALDAEPGAVTIGDGRVFAVSKTTGVLSALSAATGKVQWQFEAAGGLDSPPTFEQKTGCLLQGGRDGVVYCLRASDGALVWKFRAAPKRINTVAFGQVESVWPVHGAVLVENGVAYVCAGRSSYLDGGVHIYGLDVATGKVLHRRVITSERVGAMEPPPDADRYKQRIKQNWMDYLTFLAPDKSDSFSMEGLRADIMSARDGSVFLRHMVLDRKLQPQDGIQPHLTSTSSILDDTQHNRAYWLLGMGKFERIPVAYSWILQKSIGVPYGVMMSFDSETVWSIHQQGRKRGKVVYALVAMPRPDPSDPDNLQPDFAERASARKEPLWRVELPLRPRAVLSAGGAIYVAGITDSAASLLRVEPDGIKERYSLPAAPVWDGMAASDSKLVVPLIDGSVRCFGGGNAR